MKVDLRPVTRDTVRTLWRLEVADDQRDFVAPNLATLAAGPYEGGAHPMGIWRGDTAVGFLSMIDAREHLHPEDGDDPESAYLWRFMIAEGHQNQGHGRAALLLLADWVRARGLARFYTSVVPENLAALALYESVGFKKTGRLVDGEIELLWTLA